MACAAVVGTPGVPAATDPRAVAGPAFHAPAIGALADVSTTVEPTADTSPHPPETVITRCTRRPCRSRASPRCTRRVAIPPVSPWPEWRNVPSTSPWRKSCTTVRPLCPPPAPGVANASDSARVAACASDRTDPSDPGDPSGPADPPVFATQSSAARAGAASGTTRHPGSVRRSPRPDSAAARTSAASPSSLATCVSRLRDARRGTRPTVSTSRVRASGSRSNRIAAANPAWTASGAVTAHRSRVRWASMPAKPPCAQRRTRSGMPAVRGPTSPSASTACSATCGRWSASRATRWSAACAPPWAPRARTAATAVIGSASAVAATSRSAAPGGPPRAASWSRSPARSPSRMVPDDLTAAKAAPTSMRRP